MFGRFVTLVMVLAAGTLGAAPLRVALYVDDGCRGTGLLRWAEIFRDSPDAELKLVSGQDIRDGALDDRELVAVCEPDPNAMKNFWNKAAKTWKSEDLVAAKTYADYRVMFDEVGDTLDAVFVATPNHHHALPTLLAIRHGVNVFVEKPMAHTMEEVLLIEKEARTAGVVVRVGNKGHNMTHRPALAKTLMLSNALAFAGKGTYAWDSVANKTSSKVANAHLGLGYRKGWEIA